MQRSNISRAGVPDFRWEDMANCEMFKLLKYIKVSNLSGKEGEMGLVKFLLFKAHEVKEIKFVPPRSRLFVGGNKIMDISEDSWMTITRKVLEFETTSPKAKLLFL